MKRLLQLAFRTLALTLLVSSSVLAANLSSTVDRNLASINETIRLQVSYDQRVDSNSLDRKALEKDFEVLAFSPQSSSSVSIINGQATRLESTVWNITLAAKREGKLLIPAFEINGDKSSPISIEVSNFAQAANSNAPLSAKVSVSSRSVRPSEQLMVEIEISAAADVSNLNGSPLLINDADIEEIGQQTFQRVDNGIARQIAVIKYAVFPQKPGKLAIPIMTFTGVKGARRSVFRSGGQQVIARTKQLSIDVEAIPVKDKATWFPAESVTIDATWSGDLSDLKVGTPITRTLTITAVGQRAATIPPLPQATISSDYKSYSDQAQLENNKTDAGFVSTRKESEAIVPAKSGELVMPEIKLNWWNTKSKQWEKAVLAEQTITVTGATSLNNIGNPPIQQTTDQTAEATPNTLITLSEINRLVLAFAALLTVICLIQFWLIIKLKRSGTTNIDQDEQALSSQQHWKSLRHAFKKGDPSLVRKCLLNWANSVNSEPTPVTLTSFAKAANSPELADAILQLESHLYHGADKANLDALSSALAKFKNSLGKKTKGRKRANNLNALYPSEPTQN